MAEIWGAAIAAGGAILSAYSAKKEKDEDRKAAKAGTKDEAIYSSVLSQFNKEQDEYYDAVNRQKKQRGLDEFRKFNTVRQFAPEYAQTTNQGVVVPEKPSVTGILEGVGVAPGGGDGKSGSSGMGLLKKADDAENKFRRHLDPIGAKISRKDPIRKALGI